MGGHIELKVNNVQTLFLTQVSKDGDTVLSVWDGENDTYAGTIPVADLVMLLNFYYHVKGNDIKNDFINPYGRKEQE